LNNTKPYNQYLGLATQMLVSLLATFFIGKWIDQKLHFHKPSFVIILPIFTIIATLYKIVKDISSSK
jgi:F0F1-type ATP synthase assembly protein I